jgi:hypothetical protein
LSQFHRNLSIPLAPAFASSALAVICHTDTSPNSIVHITSCNHRNKHISLLHIVQPTMCMACQALLAGCILIGNLQQEQTSAVQLFEFSKNHQFQFFNISELKNCQSHYLGKKIRIK